MVLQSMGSAWVEVPVMGDRSSSRQSGSGGWKVTAPAVTGGGDVICGVAGDGRARVRSIEVGDAE